MRSNTIESSHLSRAGFTLLELFIVIIIFVVLIGMLLPGMRNVREPARRSACQNNQKQLILACLNFESAHLKFPSMRGAMQDGMQVSDGNAPTLSGMVSLLPFLEQGVLFEQISTATTLGGISYAAWGPSTTDATYEPWSTRLSMLQCPSSPVDQSSKFGTTSYAFSMGDLARGLNDPKQLRGLFGGNLSCQYKDIGDGSSNTIAFGETGGPMGRGLRGNYATKQSAEILNDPSLVLSLIDAKGDDYKESITLGDPKRGGHWAAGEPCFNGFNTILPPDSPSAMVLDRADGIFSAASLHVGLVVVAYADGSTHSIPSEIDCGSAATATYDATTESGERQTASPYGVWGSLGTINGGEVIDSVNF